jgi:small-conductance mechanosensitive channel
VWPHAVERCYKEQRLLTAAHESFSKSNRLLRRAWVTIWGIIIGALGMVVWGLEIYSSWLLPATSLLLSVSFLLGRLPAEMLTGAVYALISRPFEIGDKIRLARPGWKTHESSPIYWCVVKDQDLMHTHLIAQNGETMIIENYVLRQLLVTNVTRSGPVLLQFPIQIPIRTPANKVNELLDAIGQYVRSKPNEWINIDMFFEKINSSDAYMELKVWATCAVAAHEKMRLFACKSRLLMFAHTYMQTANMELVLPASMESFPRPKPAENAEAQTEEQEREEES